MIARILLKLSRAWAFRHDPRETHLSHSDDEFTCPKVHEEKIEPGISDFVGVCEAFDRDRSRARIVVYRFNLRREPRVVVSLVWCEMTSLVSVMR